MWKVIMQKGIFHIFSEIKSKILQELAIKNYSIAQNSKNAGKKSEYFTFKQFRHQIKYKKYSQYSVCESTSQQQMQKRQRNKLLQKLDPTYIFFHQQTFIVQVNSYYFKNDKIKIHSQLPKLKRVCSKNDKLIIYSFSNYSFIFNQFINKMADSLGSQRLLTSVSKKQPLEYNQMNSFNQIFKKIKQKMRITQFIANISKNNIYSKPVEYRLQSVESHIVDWKGWEIHTTFQNIILILDIYFTLINFILSTFEAFLGDYQNFKNDHPYIIILNIIAVIIYILKTILSLGTQEVDHGTQYIYLTDIIKKQLLKPRFYVQVSLAIIILINIGFGSLDSEITGIIYFVLCIFKIYNLSSSLFKIEIMLVKTPKRRRYWNFIKVFMLNILFAHFTASIFLAMLKMDQEKNWYQTKSGIPPNPKWFELYLWSLYWACTTMITVGYGDFSPANVDQAVIVSALQILSSIVVAYNISQIGSIILSINERNEFINAKIGLLRRMNNENPVSMDLNVTMEQYLIHESKILEEFQYAKHMELIRSMPTQLQLQYYGQAQKNIFRKTPFFMSLSAQTLTNFFLQSQGKVYYPEQFIIQKVYVQQINIVLKGQLGYCYRKAGSSLNNTIIQKININYSNERPLLLARGIFNKTEGIYFDIKATKYSYSIIISVETFLSILRENEIDYHYYLMTLDIHQSQTTYAFKKCEYCRYGQHTKFQCPKLHFTPMKSQVISKQYETRHTSKNQQRSRPNKPRRTRAIHVYALKYAFNTENTKKSQFTYKKKPETDQLRLIIMCFGDKKTHQNVSNGALQRMFRKSIIMLDVLDDDLRIKEIVEDVDQLCDFHHYFTPHNPSKLLHLSVKISSNQLVRPATSPVMGDMLTKLLVNTLNSY